MSKWTDEQTDISTLATAARLNIREVLLGMDKTPMTKENEEHLRSACKEPPRFYCEGHNRGHRDPAEVVTRYLEKRGEK